MQEESIYNIIPQEYVPPPKGRMYRSKHSPEVPPTSSTFINHTTSRPGVANVKGNKNLGMQAHTHKGDSKSFGPPKGAAKPNSSTFLKRGTGISYNAKSTLPEIHHENSLEKYYSESRKEAIPKKEEKPIMGLKSDKNFIVSNAVDNITAAPKVFKENVKYVNKKDYGKVPEYLNKIRSRIDEDYTYLAKIQEEDEQMRNRDKIMLQQAELEQLREGLRRKYEYVNKEYQSITHIVNFDSQGLKKKKEGCEKEMAQIEKDIEKLNKQIVFVDLRRQREKKPHS